MKIFEDVEATRLRILSQISPDETVFSHAGAFAFA
jgi:hypothetical protein